MRVTRLDEVETTTARMEGAQGVYKQVPLSRKHGAPTFSFRVFTIEPRGHTPFHQHSFEHMNYVIHGEGVLVADDGQREIREGDFALILPGEKHQYRNSSESQNLVLICAVPTEHE
jgi:quercetin dioxygenase-like cupin family protein